MSTTAIERRADSNGGDVALFAGATPDEIIAVATDAANKFSDVVKQRRMSRRIGENDHIQIEAWQTIGALTGVLADEGEVDQLAWPALEPLGEEPPFPEGREPTPRDSQRWREWKEMDKTRRAWELHRDMLRARAMGRAYGYRASFRAAKGGQPVGWGLGLCTRGEAAKVNQEDYALSSMAQTRGQSRALGAPLKFVVKLAGYETTPAEELDGAGSAPTADAAPAPPWGPVTDDDKALADAAHAVKVIAGDVPINAEEFVLAMGQAFDGVPEACVKMLRGLARALGTARASQPDPAQASPADVYPEGRYQGD